MAILLICLAFHLDFSISRHEIQNPNEMEMIGGDID